MNKAVLLNSGTLLCCSGLSRTIGGDFADAVRALKDEKHLPLLLVKGKPPEAGHAVSARGKGHRAPLARTGIATLKTA